MASMRRLWAVCVMLIVVILLPVPSAQDFSLTVGKHEIVQSKALGERRDILVSVPHQAKPNMPLLVVLDGEWTFTKVAVIVDHLVSNGRLPPMVVAGIVNTDRGRGDVSEVLVYRRALSGAEVGAISRLEDVSLTLKEKAGAEKTGTCHMNASK
jgi:enterochelin esterase-like enzyme